KRVLDAAPVASRGVRRALLEGIVVEALNVKTALFFVAFLPPFVSPGGSVVAQLVLLGGICVALNPLVDVAAGVAAHRLGGSRAVSSTPASTATCGARSTSTRARNSTLQRSRR